MPLQATSNLILTASTTTVSLPIREILKCRIRSHALRYCIFLCIRELEISRMTSRADENFSAAASIYVSKIFAVEKLWKTFFDFR